MRSLQITPGEWMRDSDYIVSSDYPIDVGYIAETGNSEFWKGDANLIAAAPDLYRALDAIVYAETQDELYALLKNGRKALAKARGE